MKKRILSFVLALAMVLGVMPFSAFAAPDDHATGLGDTAYYYLDMKADTNSTNGYRGWNDGGWTASGDTSVVEVNGEHFQKFSINPTHALGDPYYIANTLNPLYGNGGVVADSLDDVASINYLAWRIKATAGDDKIGVSISLGTNGTAGWINTANAIFIDNATRQPVELTYIAETSGVFFPEEGFDGWMILDLTKEENTDIIAGYNKDVSVKEYLLTQHTSGTWQYYFHQSQCNHITKSGAEIASTWTGRSIDFGDILMVEDLDTFTSVRMSCENMPHVLEVNVAEGKKECKFCDYSEDYVVKSPVKTGDFSTGKPDSAFYYANVPDSVETGLPGYNAWSGASNKVLYKIVDIDGETFVNYNTVTGDANHCCYPAKLTFSDGKVDSSIPADEVNYLAVRLKATLNTSPLGFSISVGWDGKLGWLNASSALFIDNETRKATTTAVTAAGSGYFNITFKEDFDGWMIINLNENFIGNYTGADATHKEYLLNTHGGGFQYYLHNGGGCHGDRVSTDWSVGAAINVGDWLFVDDIDTFKNYRFSCEGSGHVLAPTDDVTPPDCENEGYTIMECVYCDHTEPGNFVDATGHTWVETGRDAAGCETPEYIYVECACGKTDTQEGEPATGHSMYTIEYVEPTCKEPGYLEEDCEVCGNAYNWVDLEPAHKYEDDVCVFCGEANPEALPKHETEEEHIWEEVKTEPATCQIPDKTYYTCICGGEKVVEGSVVDHNMVATGVKTDATCVAVGSEELTCSFGCGEAKTVELPINPDAHTFMAGVCTLCGAANPVSYKTGKNDTATYYANVPDSLELDLPGYSAWPGSYGGVSREMVEIDGETFVKYFDSKNGNDCTVPTKMTYADGMIDQKAVDTSAMNYLVWRVKADVDATPLTFFISVGFDMSVGLINGSKLTFVDLNTREVNTTSVEGKTSGFYSIRFLEDFDGYMIANLNEDFMGDYKQSAVTESQKDYFLNKHNGRLQYYTCGGCHQGGDSEWTNGAYIALGDIFMVENLDTFKAVRLSCDALGHEYGEDGACKFCGEANPDAGHGEDDHVWEPTSTVPGTCSTPAQITYTCSCGASKTEDGDLDPNNHSFKAGACTGCGAAYDKSYATGKNDTAHYWANVPDDVATGLPGYSQWGGSNYNIGRALTEIDGETFISYSGTTVNKDSNDCTWPTKLTYTEDGIFDVKAVDTDKINYWVWRIKADVNTTPIAFSIALANAGAGWLKGDVAATFIDINTRDVVDTVVAKGSGYYNITFNADFDGYMVIDLSKDFIGDYTQSGKTSSHKDFLLNYYNGQNQYYFHDNCHGTEDIDWTGASLNIGDIFVVENLDTFKAVRLSCDEIGHAYGEDDLCKFCGQENPDAGHGDDDHVWEPTSTVPGTCSTPAQITYTCSCGASKTEDGDLDPNNHTFKGGACTGCGAAYDKSYATGLGDTATYYANVPDDVALGMPSGTLGGNDTSMKREFVEIDGETFIKYSNVTGDQGIYGINFSKTIYADGKIDQKAVDTAAQNFWAWRIKVDVVNGPVAFTISIGNDYSKGRLDASGATFVDFNTREAVDTVVAAGGGHNPITFTADFDGWMIVDLSTAFIDAGAADAKDFILNQHNGGLHFYFHQPTEAKPNCHGITDADWSDGAYIAIGDMLMIEDLDAFKAVRYSCDALGHDFENGACKFCGEAEPLPPVPAPENPALTVSGATENSITVNWDAVEGVNSYFVQVIDKATGAIVRILHVVDATEATIYGLAESTEYTVAICSHVPGRPVAYTAPIDAATTAKAVFTNPTPVIGAATATTIDVSWNAVDGANGYFVQVTDKATGAVVRVVHVVGATYTTIYGLTADTQYAIAICAHKVGVPATYSAAVDAATVAEAALSLNVTVEGKEATFTWTKPANAVAYYLYVLKNGEIVRVAGVSDANATSFVIWVPDAEGCTFGIIAATQASAKVEYSPMQFAAN